MLAVSWISAPRLRNASRVNPRLGRCNRLSPASIRNERIVSMVNKVAILTAGGFAPCLSSAIGGLIERYTELAPLSLIHI